MALFLLSCFAKREAHILKEFQQVILQSSATSSAIVYILQCYKYQYQDNYIPDILRI